jgi:hypothetical protein
MLIAGPQVLLRLITTCLAVYSAELHRQRARCHERSLQSDRMCAGMQQPVLLSLSTQVFQYAPSSTSPTVVVRRWRTSARCCHCCHSAQVFQCSFSTAAAATAGLQPAHLCPVATESAKMLSTAGLLKPR